MLVTLVVAIGCSYRKPQQYTPRYSHRPYGLYLAVGPCAHLSSAVLKFSETLAVGFMPHPRVVPAFDRIITVPAASVYRWYVIGLYQAHPHHLSISTHLQEVRDSIG